MLDVGGLRQGQIHEVLTQLPTGLNVGLVVSQPHGNTGNLGGELVVFNPVKLPDVHPQQVGHVQDLLALLLLG